MKQTKLSSFFTKKATSVEPQESKSPLKSKSPELKKLSKLPENEPKKSSKSPASESKKSSKSPASERKKPSKSPVEPKKTPKLPADEPKKNTKSPEKEQKKSIKLPADEPKKTRKRAIIYSDSEDDPIPSPTKSSAESKESTPTPLEEEETKVSRKSVSKSPEPAKTTSVPPKKAAKKNGLNSVSKGRVTKGQKAGSKIQKSTKETAKASSKSKKPEKKSSSSSEAEDEEMEISDDTSPKGKNGSSVHTSPAAKTTSTDSPKKVEPKKEAVQGWDLEYDPSKSKYDPIQDASWSRGQSVPYLAFAITLKKIEGTSSRLKNIEILANFFRSVILLSPQDLRFSVYLCLNKLAPAYEGVELGIAETNLIKTISQSTGRSVQDIKKQLSEKDLGEIAESSRSSQKTLFQSKPLTVPAVFAKLKEIAGMTGTACQQKKISLIQSMLVACKYCEARFLIRSLAGKLRIGLAEQSLLQALGQACYLTPPNQNQADPDVDWPPKAKLINAGKGLHPDEIKSRAEKVAFALKSCFCECPNYDRLISALLKDGIEGLENHCKLTPGIPPRPMLAQPTKGVDEILQRFTGIRFTCEYKYDGERAQIHLLEDGSVQVYSRNQENNTLKYPDIVNRFKDCVGPNVTSCILDSEAVAWDREKETILPFQVLSTRKRKDANEAEIKVQVIIFGFDLIFLNGESLVKEPLVKRRELLREHFTVIPGQFEFANNLDTDSMEQVQEFLEDSIKDNCEGLMVKTLDVNASYELAKRSHKWLKLKKDYLNTGGDSLDLVVIGGFLGKGKRTGTYGAYLLACYDPDNEEFQTICKLGTGFSDEELEQHTNTLKTHLITKPKPYYQFHPNLTPDHWFDAVLVWEVKCADLSLSPVHKAAAGLEDPERGISLRFPRFIRIRDDKGSEDATAATQVAHMYKNQQVVKSSNGGDRDIEDDFY